MGHLHWNQGLQRRGPLPDTEILELDAERSTLQRARGPAAARALLANQRETHGLSRGRPNWSSGGQTHNYPSPNAARTCTHSKWKPRSKLPCASGTAHTRLVRVALTYRTEAPGRTCQHRSSPAPVPRRSPACKAIGGGPPAAVALADGPRTAAQAAGWGWLVRGGSVLTRRRARAVRAARAAAS